jgi:hypothetical protein
MNAVLLSHRSPLRSVSVFSARPAIGLLQRKCACGGSTRGAEPCEACRQAKARPGLASAAGQRVPDAQAVLRVSGTPLAPFTRAFMEQRFGHNFARVRVHADTEAARSAQQVYARAYTFGPHIVFGSGEYRPGTQEGNHLIAHELAHVVQQSGGAPQGLQRQADSEDEAMAADVTDDIAQSEDGGGGVETEESSTEDIEPDTAVPEDAEMTDETAPAQFKSSYGAALSRLPGLEHEADRAADDALSGRAVRVSPGAAAAAMQRAPKRSSKPAVPMRCGRPDTRVADFPATFIKHIGVDLTSPDQNVTLTWEGPNAGAQQTGPFHGSPGAGCCDKDCDDKTTSNQGGSDCTPKVSDAKIHNHSCQMKKYPEAKNVSWFDRNGIAFHFYPSVPKWPASHGCVRVGMEASRLIYDNTVEHTTTVDVDGTWKRHDAVCWSCGGGAKKGKGGKKK